MKTRTIIIIITTATCALFGFIFMLTSLLRNNDTKEK